MRHPIINFVVVEGRDFLKRLLTVDAEKRMTISQIRTHPWFLMEFSELAQTLDVSGMFVVVDFQKPSP